jgi:hypothetical protein
MNADAEIAGTSLARSKAATRSSSAGSFGEWMRFTPQFGLPPGSARNSATARSTLCKPGPPAPKKPSISARVSAMTMPVAAMPVGHLPGDAREPNAVRLAE